MPEAQAIPCRRRHQPRRPPPAKIRPWRPAQRLGRRRPKPDQRVKHRSNPRPL